MYQTTDSDDLLSTTEAAQFLGLSPATLESWRSRPPISAPAIEYYKVGRSIRYRRSTLTEWLATRKRNSTTANRPAQSI